MNKLTKLLSVFIIAGTMVGAGGALAGCNKTPAHEHDYKYVSDGASGHHQECKDGDDTKAVVDHNFGDDNTCDDCLYVKPAEVVNVTGVTLDKETETVKVGATVTLTATVAPEGATNKTVIWSSSNEAVARVADGVVTAVAKGTATITAKTQDGDFTDTVEVTVENSTLTFNMDGKGGAIESIETTDGTVTRPEDPKAPGYIFGGWFSDAECKTEFDFTKKLTADTTVYAKWTEHNHVYNESEWAFDSASHFHACTTEADCPFRKDEAAHEIDPATKKCTVCGTEFRDAVFELIPSDLEAKTYADGFSSGIFSLLPTTTIRNRARENYDVYDLESNVVASGFTAKKSVQYNGTKRGLSIYAPAKGTLTLYLDNGSSGLAEGDFQHLVWTKPDGTTEDIAYPAKKLRRYVIEIEKEGEYTLTRGSNGTTDIYYAKFEATVPVTSVEKMEVVNPGETEFLIGQEIDTSKLQVQLTYSKTNMVEPVALSDARLEIDVSAYKKDVAGTYTIKVKFTDDEGRVFNDTFDVTVFGVEALKLGFNEIKQGNDGYNGTYKNIGVKQFYFVGDTIDLSGLSVYTVFKNGKAETKVTEGFSTNAAEIDMNTAGKKEIVVKWGDSQTIVAKFNIFVAQKPEISGDAITASVSAAVAEDNIGVALESVYQFKTIQQALEFFGALELDDNVKKIINLAEGTYNEKVEVTLPNVTINGGEDATKYVIEWDALYGEKDESGFEHTTDSTATLNVRRTAVGFTIKGVTMSNKWNSTEYFDANKGAGYGEHRALAALFQCDKVYVENCRMLGYQDTVEFFTGRQIVKDTFIQGRTDFIFGTNNTTYFYNCEIHSIVKSGYLTAFKGCNKGAEDAVTYGAIFDHCKFTKAEAITDNDKDTAIGRPWGAYAAVAVINSELGGHISLEASTGKSSGERYVTMSNNNPYDANVKFVEYNNTGAGAITAEVRGMKMLTAEEAANYSNLSVIFAKTNGNVTYTSDWDGTAGSIVTEKTYRFSNYYNANDGKTWHTTTGEEEFFGNFATVNGSWGHELNQNKDQAKFGAGTVITVKKVGEVSVTTYGGAYGLPENVKVHYKDGYATLTIQATASSPIANGCYLTSITLDSSKTPADSDVVYSFVGGSENVSGTDAQPASMFDGDVSVVGSLRNNDNSYQASAGTKLTFAKQGAVKITWFDGYGSDENAEIFYTGGKAEVTITGAPYIIAITLDTSVIPADSAVVFEEDKVVDLTALATAYEGNVGRYEGIEIDATTGKFANNNSGWIQMNTGTVLKVFVGSEIKVSVTEYNDAGLVTVSERAADGAVTITATGNTYISKVTFTIVREYTHDYVVDMTGMTASYQGNKGSYLGFAIDATAGKFASNGSGWIQMNNGTVLKVKVGAGLKVTVKEYNDAGLVTVSERDAEGYVTLTATGNTYISTVTFEIPLTEITEDYTYTYAQGTRTDGTLEIGTDKIKFENCKVNNSWLKYGGTGSSITLKLSKGATLRFTRSPYDGDGSTVSINGVAQTADKGEEIVFIAAEAGTYVITADSTCYLASISVEVDAGNIPA